jgi:DNA/RNA-binding domain of Phe-tRNA-synthetase-like protein
MLPTIARDPALGGIVRSGLVAMDEIDAGRRPDALGREIDETVADLRRRWAGRTAGEIPHLAAARALYRALGIDPTRHRPSPEALLRRLLRGDPFPRHAPPVDLANLWAVLHGLPVGLYDLEAVRGPLVLRLGRPGESYPGIGKPEIRLEGRLVLADDEGPFGNPTADSLRTAVGASTTAALAVLFAPADHPVDDMNRWLRWLEERAPALLGGTARHRLD